jgi:hypothetical protein
MLSRILRHLHHRRAVIHGLRLGLLIVHALALAMRPLLAFLPASPNALVRRLLPERDAFLARRDHGLLLVSGQPHGASYQRRHDVRDQEGLEDGFCAQRAAVGRAGSVAVRLASVCVQEEEGEEGHFEVGDEHGDHDGDVVVGEVFGSVDDVVRGEEVDDKLVRVVSLVGDHIKSLGAVGAELTFWITVRPTTVLKEKSLRNTLYGASSGFMCA